MPGFLPEIHGHDEARERLRRLLRSERVPAGLLLTGEEGVGKRTLALAFARVMLAGDREGSVEPTSARARKFDSGQHADFVVVERDAAQRQLGIERIRELKESFSLTPVEGARKLAVVVDAERLTDEAGNALLKLLEEPPAGGHLILTARDQGAILPTLLSRSQWIPLRPLGTDEVIAFLASRGVEEGRRSLAAVLSEGRPGLALRLAESDPASEILPPAMTLAVGAREPFGGAEELAGGVKDAKKTLEDARERLRPLLRIAVVLLRSAWRAGCRLRRAARCRTRCLPPPVRPRRRCW